MVGSMIVAVNDVCTPLKPDLNRAASCMLLLSSIAISNLSVFAPFQHVATVVQTNPEYGEYIIYTHAMIYDAWFWTCSNVRHVFLQGLEMLVWCSNNWSPRTRLWMLTMLMMLVLDAIGYLSCRFRWRCGCLQNFGKFIPVTSSPVPWRNLQKPPQTSFKIFVTIVECLSWDIFGLYMHDMHNHAYLNKMQVYDMYTLYTHNEDLSPSLYIIYVSIYRHNYIHI